MLATAVKSQSGEHLLLAGPALRLLGSSEEKAGTLGSKVKGGRETLINSLPDTLPPHMLLHSVLPLSVENISR